MNDNDAEKKTPLTKSLIHLPLILVSIILAVVIGRSDIVGYFLSYGEIGYTLAALIFGVMYSSIFSVIPATVGIIKLAEAGAPPLVLAIVGGLGAMIGDLSIFQIIKFSVLDDIIRYMQRHSQGRFERVFKMPIVRYTLVIVGAMIVASPIPDEIGLAMMGLAQTRWPIVAVISFLLNSVGILVIAMLAR